MSEPTKARANWPAKSASHQPPAQPACDRAKQTVLFLSARSGKPDDD